MNNKATMYAVYAACVLLSLALFSCSKIAAQNKDKSFVETHGQLSVKGTVLTDKDENPFVLQGVSFGWHNWWSRFYDPATVAWLNKDWNCKLVRAAIGVEPENGYIENPDFALQCLYNVVDEAISKDMYVIIDWHSHGVRTAEAKTFFTMVASKYKEYPNVIYEIFNEPVESSWQEVKAYSEEIIKTIRAIDPHNIILVGSPHWDQDIHLVANDPIQGYDNIMYTLHFYAATHKQFLRDRADYALKKGIPIFVSECAGMEASGGGDIDIAEWNIWREWMSKNQISWAAWSVSGKDETCSMIKYPDSPVSGWTEQDLKEWGKIVRETLLNSH